MMPLTMAKAGDTVTIQKERGISVIYITHDLGVVAKVADYVDVMYAGKIVETGIFSMKIKRTSEYVISFIFRSSFILYNSCLPDNNSDHNTPFLY